MQGCYYFLQRLNPKFRTVLFFRSQPIVNSTTVLPDLGWQLPSAATYRWPGRSVARGKWITMLLAADF